MALIRCSKANNCTVHGAITAATHLAMSQILDQRNQNPHFKTPFSMDTNYTVNVRKECHPKIGSEEFGLYAIFDALRITVPSLTMERGVDEMFLGVCTHMHKYRPQWP
ncbi:hypothetical protein OS493_033320 [Desmophyllum pertusum]|uniref:Uncharacterized protein n=1 Tax=Desmophyllum pertusum TaxID=174260 RepID=A0A9W9Z7S2_9CNID|nr:hypothetical protein OS493_033320 [Desmophyllum pertusum]